MNPRFPIIERPNLQSLRQRAALGLVGILGWAVWLYLWLPFATFGGWIFGGWLFQRQMVAPMHGYLITLAGYLGVIVLLAVLFLGWALYNGARFRGVDRRKARPITVDEDMAAFFEVSVDEMMALRQARRGVLHFSPEGGITGMDLSSPPVSRPVPAPFSLPPSGDTRSSVPAAEVSSP